MAAKAKIHPKVLVLFAASALSAAVSMPAIASQGGGHPDVAKTSTGGRTEEKDKLFVTSAGVSYLQNPGLADQRRVAQLRSPLVYTRITSLYGWRISPVFRRRMFHRGIDLGAPDGTPVHASEDGEIAMMEGRPNFGFYVRIRHGNSLETAYGHLLKFMPGLHRGSVVRRGDVIGFVGATGLATGPHLHFEVLLQGRPIDPEGALGQKGAPHLVGLRQ